MSKIKIVLAEDEPSLGQILKESLETRGFLVYHAPNGKVAYDYYLQRNPDILVLDVMMPIKDGFTLAKEIRKENTSIPIIFLTAKSQTKDVLDGRGKSTLTHAAQKGGTLMPRSTFETKDQCL